MARPTLEGCESLIITTRSLTGRPLVAGLQRSGTIYFELDAGQFPVTVTIDTRDPARAFVGLAHVARRDVGGVQHYAVALYSTPQPFGGVRWWFLCPLTGRRATKLVLPRGGHRFACRRAWSLGYRCQRSGKLDLISQRANKLHRALGGTGWWRDGIPPKPKWMRWPTYTQKARALRDLVGQFNATWAAGVMRRFPQL